MSKLYGEWRTRSVSVSVRGAVFGCRIRLAVPFDVDLMIGVGRSRCLGSLGDRRQSLAAVYKDVR